MSIPKGVTVRKVGDPRPQGKPRNILERAALSDDLLVAKAFVAGPLGLNPESQMAIENLSEDWRWKRIDPASRLMELANWLKAECYECMDLVEVGPVSTAGD